MKLFPPYLLTNINALIFYVLRTFLRYYYMLLAFVTGRRFYCNALNGSSGYDISVNCDMTVSCTCADYDGSGVIGNLREQMLQEIFDGSQARKFRTSMAAGRLPILQCATCGDRRMIVREKAGHYISNYSVPTLGIMVENTINCNLRCISCSRELIEKQRHTRRMSLDDIKIVSRMIKENGIKSVSFFKLGEPFAVSSIRDELSVIRTDNPAVKILIETNGILVNTDEKREGALICDRIRFALDGIDDRMVRRYRRNGSFTVAYDNLRALVDFRNSRGLQKPVIEWKYIVFNWNDREEILLNAIEMARKAGADGISFWPTVSPFWAISLRYRLKKYSQRFAAKKESSFYVDLR